MQIYTRSFLLDNIYNVLLVFNSYPQLYFTKKNKVIGVEGTYKECSEKNVICPLVNSYFKKIDFPEDTQRYMDNLYEQIKPNIQTSKMK